MIQLSHVEKTYIGKETKTQALNDANLEIKDNEIHRDWIDTIFDSFASFFIDSDVNRLFKKVYSL